MWNSLTSNRIWWTGQPTFGVRKGGRLTGLVPRQLLRTQLLHWRGSILGSDFWSTWFSRVFQLFCHVHVGDSRDSIDFTFRLVTIVHWSIYLSYFPSVRGGRATRTLLWTFLYLKNAVFWDVTPCGFCKKTFRKDLSLPLSRWKESLR
jgi:hypothetical protein